jgi:hypothetical protein
MECAESVNQLFRQTIGNDGAQSQVRRTPGFPREPSREAAGRVGKRRSKGSACSFRREAETERSGLCSDEDTLDRLHGKAVETL